MCDYARDGTFSLVDSGDKSVWFVLKTASGVVFDGQVMSIGAALEEASVAHGCECGLAGHEVGRRREEGDTINDDSSDTLMGIPVSPGTITAEASVIMNPSEFSNMIPGSILVCPMTSPAWTQLFAHAQGLVTDIGGILGHGSIVAREYGIPAVVGTGNCKVRIKHGQMIEVDGDGGTVMLVED